MPYPNVMADIRRAIAGHKPERMPLLALSEEFDVRVAGEAYEDYATNSKVIERVQTYAIERFGYDWAWLQIDDCFIVELLGVGVQGGGNIPVATKDYLPALRTTLNSLKRPNVRQQGRCPVLLDAIKRLKDRFGESLLVMGRIEAPFSAATLLYGIGAASMLVYDDPGLLRGTMEFFCEVQIEFGNAQIEAGADGLWHGDCNGSSNILSLPVYQDLVFEPLKKVLAATQGLRFLYSGEKDPKYVDVMADAGADVLGVTYEADLAACHEVINGRCALIGHLHPIEHFMNGTPESVSTATEHILRTVSTKGGHLINSGDAVPHQTPAENMIAYLDAVRRVWPQLAEDGTRRTEPDRPTGEGL